MIKNIGRKLGVLGTLFCCLGLTQTGPCPGGQQPPSAGGDTCATPAECAPIECRVAACTEGECLYTNAGEGTPCDNENDTEDNCNGPDTCNPEGACQDNEVADNNPCLSGQDTNSCTNDVCDGGVCTHNDLADGAVCDDESPANACTRDTCSSGACTHPPVVNGTPCGDDTDDDCTDADTCLAGVCEANNVADPTANPAVFVDPAETTFCTADVRDVDGEIVRFNTVVKSIIWADDDREFEVGRWLIIDGVILAEGQFQVRFGSEGGLPHAYFTETGNGFICQIEPQGAGISITGTTTPVPHN